MNKNIGRLIQYKIPILILILLLMSNYNLFSQNSKMIEQYVIGSGGAVGLRSPTSNVRINMQLGQTAIETISNSSNINAWQGFWVYDSLYFSTGIEENISFSYSIKNYPNPLNKDTRFAYTIPGAAFVNLKIYDLIGNEIDNPIKEMQGEGEHEFTWIAIDKYGTELHSGTYLYEMTVSPIQSAGGSDFKGFSMRNVMVIIK